MKQMKGDIFIKIIALVVMYFFSDEGIYPSHWSTKNEVWPDFATCGILLRTKREI